VPHDGGCGLECFGAERAAGCLMHCGCAVLQKGTHLNRTKPNWVGGAYLTQSLGAIEVVSAPEAPVVNGAGGEVLVETLLIDEPPSAAAAICISVIVGHIGLI
jgi:hypothetical protein